MEQSCSSDNERLTFENLFIENLYVNLNLFTREFGEKDKERK